MILALKTSEDPAEILLLADDFEVFENKKFAKKIEISREKSENLDFKNLQFGEILAKKIWKAERNLARDLLFEIEKLILNFNEKNAKNCLEISRKNFTNFENFDEKSRRKPLENLCEKSENREKNLAEKSEKFEKNFAENSEKIDEKIDGKLAENLCEIDENFVKNPREKNAFSQISAIIIFRGPGSFTGLRIGISVANALAYARNVLVVGAENSSENSGEKSEKSDEIFAKKSSEKVEKNRAKNSENWLKNGLKNLREIREKNFAKNLEKNSRNLQNDENFVEENGVKFVRKSDLLSAANFQIVLPKYFSAPHITMPKK